MDNKQKTSSNNPSIKIKREHYIMLAEIAQEEDRTMSAQAGWLLKQEYIRRKRIPFVHMIDSLYGIPT